MKFKSIETFDEKQKLEYQSKFKEEDNKYITETAGFVPLEVKLKQFEQNGLIAQFQVSEFTSTDYRNMYLNPDFDITPEDEIEDIQEKLEALRAYQEEYKKSKVGNFEKIADPPSGSAAAAKEEVQVSELKEVPKD